MSHAHTYEMSVLFLNVTLNNQLYNSFNVLLTNEGPNFVVPGNLKNLDGSYRKKRVNLATLFLSMSLAN